MPSDVYDEITHPFPNVNGAAVFWHVVLAVITYLFED